MDSRMIAIIVRGEVAMKIIANRHTQKAMQVATDIRAAWPKKSDGDVLDIHAAYRIASDAGFGDTKSLVIVTKASSIFNGDGQLESSYEERFQERTFNPQRKLQGSGYTITVTIK